MKQSANIRVICYARCTTAEKFGAYLQQECGLNFDAMEQRSATLATDFAMFNGITFYLRDDGAHCFKPHYLDAVRLETRDNGYRL